jgi:phosphatidylethanolamine/phosphatidyl-N-methylethanolamine N-methyltransferase
MRNEPVSIRGGPDSRLRNKALRQSDLGLFFRESIRSLPVTAALFPSSRKLAEALLRAVDFRKAAVIVELGVGTGAVTLEILRRMRRDAKLYAIDINPAFIRHIRMKIQDARLVAIPGRAEEMGRIVRGHSLERADAIVSSLGLSTMTEPQRRTIIGQALECLGPRGVLSQFQYLHAGGEPNWMCRMGWTRFSEERFLKRYFGDVKSARVILNLPPARVFTCRQAIEW